MVGTRLRLHSGWPAIRLIRLLVAFFFIGIRPRSKWTLNDTELKSRKSVVTSVCAAGIRVESRKARIVDLHNTANKIGECAARHGVCNLHVVELSVSDLI